MYVGLIWLFASSALAVPDVCDGGNGLLEGIVSSGDADLRIEGQGTFDAFGRALATGDFNNDGAVDLAVGAPGLDDNGANTGGIYIFFGGLSDPTDPTTANSVLLGSSIAGYAGVSLVSGHDLDGDGIDDLVVGSLPGQSGANRRGLAYVVSGADISSNSVLPLSGATAVFDGESDGDAFGIAVAAGDVTGDGVADLVVGAAGHAAGGAVYIFEGPLLGGGNATTAHATVLSGVADSRFGESVLAGLDFDGDGFDDFVVGARKDNRAGNHAGSASVYLGGPGVLGGMDSVADAAVYTVGSAFQRHGHAMSIAGDLSGDGRDDIWVSSRTWGAAKRGRVYLFSAENMFASPNAYTADAAAIVALTGDDANDFAGSSIAGNVDVNGDGEIDVLIGAERGDGDVLLSGATWVVYGPMVPQATLSDVGAKLSGATYNSQMGISVVGGDFNGDGFDDVVTGGWRGQVSGKARGHVQVFLGGDDAADLTTFYADNDADGFGDPAFSIEACSQPPGFSANNLDCDDSSSLFRPGAPEGCADPDYNCDTHTGNVDSDGDGFDACEECDDRTPLVNPDQDEVCGDAIDNDCDGLADDGSAIDAILFCPDVDMDGYGRDGACLMACEDPGIFFGDVVHVGGDCEDTNGDVHPGAVEYCDLLDNDCNSSVDDAALDALPWYVDADLDTSGDYDSVFYACSQPDGYVANSSDCDDTRPDIRPGALEVCDFIDNNCDGTHYLGGPEDVGRARMRISGSGPRGDFGRELAFLRDWDGDGTDELVMAAPGSSDSGTRTGAVYIRRGDRHGGIWDFSRRKDDGTGYWDVRIVGTRANSNLGSSVATGDINGDGHADLLIGASGTPAPQIAQGTVYGFLGPLPDGEYGVEDASFTIRGASGGSEAGRSVALIDLDGDGFDDVVIGSAGEEDPVSPDSDHGAVHVFYSSATFFGGFTTGDAHASFYGQGRNEELGYAVANVDDIDGDGLPDLLVSGAKGGALETGFVYAIYGNATRLSGTITPDLTIDGDIATGSLGRRIAGVGDVNGDGMRDVLIGSDATRAYLWLGHATRPADGTADEVFDYELRGEVNSRAGTFVAGLGDLDGDGLHEMGIGAFRDDTGGDNAGAVFVLYGNTDWDDYADDGVIEFSNVESFARTEGGAQFPVYSASNYGVLHGARVAGIEAGQNMGKGIAGGGDFNGDGVADFVAGAPGWDASFVERDAGRVFLFLGGRFGIDGEGEVDPLTRTTYVWDEDADGFVNDSLTTFDACPLHLPISFRDPENPVARGQQTYTTPYDCDDENWQVYPGAPETSDDGVDADCDSYDGVNHPPQLNLSLSPDPAFTSDPLVATPNTFDEDGDTVAVSYVWTVNGTVVVGADTNTLTPTNFVKGDAVLVRATATDGRDTVGPYSAGVTIRNTRPSLSECRISPPMGFIDTDFDGVAVGLVDDDPADAGGLYVTYQWYMLVGPFEVELTGQTSQNLQSCSDRNTGGSLYDCQRGSILTLDCTPHDPEGPGPNVPSDPMVIGNTLPVLTGCSIDQSSADTTTELTVSSGATDADDDAVTIEYRWIVDGSDTGIGGDTYPASATSHFEQIQVVCTPTDAAGGVGASLTSGSLTIANTPPTAPSISLSPPIPRSDQDVSVTINTVGTDIDGDTVTYQYVWTVGGAATTQDESVLPNAVTVRGQEWQVTVTSWDGYVTGGSDSGIVTIVNTPPSVDSVVIAPTSPKTNTTIQATASGWTDADADPPSYEVTWYVNGVAEATGSDLNHEPAGHERGDMVYVTLRAVDNFAVGNTVTSNTVTVVNTAPTQPSISVSPSAPIEGDDLNCDLDVDGTDADGDTLSRVYTWYSDGPNDGIAGQTLLATYTSFGENWYCTLQISDGTDDAPLATSESVVINDSLAPPAPTIDATPRYRNEDSIDLTGTCIAGINDCDSLTITCNDGFGSYTYSTPCPGTAWSETISVTRGRTANCSATCTDAGGNESLTSNAVTIEVCDPTDTYDEAGLGPDDYGDDGTFPIDEWPTLHDDNSVSLTITGNIIGTDVYDWYVVRTSDDVAADAAAGLDAFNFEVEMTVGSADYEITAHRTQFDAPLECSTQTTYDDYTWDVADMGVPPVPGADNHGPPANPNSCSDPGVPGTIGPWSYANECEDHTAAFYLRVERALNDDCQPYTLRVYNGRP